MTNQKVLVRMKVGVKENPKQSCWSRLSTMRKEAKEAGIKNGYEYLESRKRNSTSAKDFSMALRTDFTRRFWRYDDVFSLRCSDDINLIFDHHISEKEVKEMEKEDTRLPLEVLDILKDSWYYGFYVGTLRWSKEQRNAGFVPTIYTSILHD